MLERLQAVLCPRRISTDLGEPEAERNLRLDRVISFLQSQDSSLDRSELVVSPSIGPNLLFLGEEILFEGHKTQVERGFGWTEVFVDPELIASRVRVFDQFFESTRDFTWSRYGNAESEDQTDALRKAVIACFEEAKVPERRLPGALE